MSIDEISRIAQSYKESCVLFAAIELKIFDKFSQGPITADALSIKCPDLSVGKIKIFLDSLATLGLLSKSKKHYSISDGIEPLLVSTSSNYIGKSLLLNQAQILDWKELPKKLSDHASKNTFEHKVFSSDGIDAYLHNIRETNKLHASQMCELINVHYKNPSLGVDIGGGHGLHSRFLLQQFQNLKMHLVDLSAALQYCKKLEGTLINQGRLSLIAADARKYSQPLEADFVMINDLLHSFPYPEKACIINNAFDIIKPGGKIFISKFTYLETGEINKNATFFSLKNIVSSTAGYLESDEELYALSKSAGFEIEKMLTLQSGKTVLIGKKASNGI